MKNFLEALDTKQLLEVRLSLKIIDDNGYPDFELFFNDQRIEHHNNKQVDIIKHINYKQGLSLKIKMHGKKYSMKKESAIIVENLSVDAINIIPDFNHYVLYENDHNNTMTTNYIGYNGDWSVVIGEPFYNWYHSVTAQGMLIRP